MVNVLVTLPIPSTTDNVALADDTQIWENEYGRLEVYPSISTGFIHQLQYTNLTWYYPDNTLDVAFRFNNSLTSGKIEYWNNNQWNNVAMEHITYNNKQYYTHRNFNVQQNQLYQFRWTYDVPANTDGKWDLLAKLSSETIQQALASGHYIILDPWWNSSYLLRKDVIIDYDYIEASLSNFPVLVIVDAGTSAKCDNGKSLRFCGSDNLTTFNFEFDNRTWNPSGNNYIWVNVSNISSTSNTYFNMYYNNSIASYGDNPQGTWDSNYIMVQHFNETSGNHIDSTVYDNDLTIDDITGQGNAIGVIGSCDDFERSETDVLSIVDITSSNTYTFECWAKYESLVNTETVVSNQGPVIQSYNDGSMWCRGAITMPLGTIGSGTWYNFVLTGDGTTAEFIRDSSVRKTGADTTDMDGLLEIGTDSGHTSWYDGLIDEIRISKIVRNASWISASYNSSKNTFLTFGAEIDLSISPPTNIFANNTAVDTINLTWTIGTNSSYTYIERNTLSSWTRGTGTLIYNNTGTNFVDIGLLSAIKYYYQFIGYNTSLDIYSASVYTNNITTPGNPSNINTVYTHSSSLNISWTNGSYADKNVVIRKLNSYPTSVSDGTLLYNGTATFYNDTSSSAVSYYKLYSWNSTVHQFSPGANVQWGSLSINCYDETTLSNLSFNVSVINNDGSQVYTAYNCVNTHAIDTNLCPQGLITVLVSNATHLSRMYYLTITGGTIYILNTYLPFNSNPELTNESHLYVLRIIEESGAAINDANITIKAYNNHTGIFETIENRYSDGYGQVEVNLFPSKLYKVFISKVGYISRIVDYIPDPIYYGIYYTRYFQLSPSYTYEETFWSNITYNIYPTLFDSHDAITFYFNISSSNSQLSWYSMIVYYYNNITSTWGDIFSSNVSSAIGGSLTYTTGNTSGKYALICSLGKTDNSQITLGTAQYGTGFDYAYIYNIYHMPSNYTSGEGLEDIIEHVLGPSPVYVGDKTVGYIALGGIFLSMFILFSFSPKFSGLAIMIEGITLGGLKYPLGLVNDNIMSWGLVVGVIIIGLIVTLVEGKKA